MVHDFYNSRYATCFAALEALKPQLAVDIHLHDHVKALLGEIKTRALVQVRLGAGWRGEQGGCLRLVTSVCTGSLCTQEHARLTCVSVGVVSVDEGAWRCRAEGFPATPPPDDLPSRPHAFA